MDEPDRYVEVSSFSVEKFPISDERNSNCSSRLVIIGVTVAGDLLIFRFNELYVAIDDLAAEFVASA